METTQALCDRLVQSLNYWINETNKSIDDPLSPRVWYNEKAFERSRGLMAKVPINDRSAILEDFGAALIGELLQSLEQRRIHPIGIAARLVDSDTGVPLRADLHELFIDALVSSRTVSSAR